MNRLNLVLKIPRYHNYCWLFAVAVFLNTTGNAQAPERELLSSFLNLSTLKNLDKPARKALIYPDFIAAFGERAANADVNMFVPDGFFIEKDSAGMLSALIWGPNKIWAHRLVFEVVRLKEQYYIRPPETSALNKFNLFDPWIRVERNINKQLIPSNKQR